MSTHGTHFHLPCELVFLLVSRFWNDPTPQSVPHSLLRCVSQRGSRVEFEYEGQLANAQHALVDFLWTELNVGPTLVESAALAKSAGHLDHYAAAKEKALNAAENVRRFIVQVKDHETRAGIAAKLAEAGSSDLHNLTANFARRRGDRSFNAPRGDRTSSPPAVPDPP